MTQTAAQLETHLAQMDTASMPYPRREPAAERAGLYPQDFLSFTALNHFGWAGARDLRDGARILIAGVGNGDATILLAEQARGTTVEIVATDVSQAAIAMTQARLAKRGLTNVTHHLLALTDLANAGFGTFDVVVCNQLHRIEDPDAGLASFAALLKEDGLLAVTVPATYGRMGVHLVQSLMQYLIADYMPRELKIQVVREFLNALPPGHWLGYSAKEILNDLEVADGSGIDAMFFQSADQNFSVGELYGLLDRHGFALTVFMGEQAADYRVETHTASPKLLSIVEAKSAPEREVIAELMHSGMCRHSFYASRADKLPAAFADERVIASVTPLGAADDFPASFGMDDITHAAALLAAIDNQRSIAEVVAMVARQRRVAPDAVRADLERLYTVLHQHRRVFLRDAVIPPYLTWDEIQKRLGSIPEAA